MDIQFIPSPNCRNGNKPKILIIHYTASGNMQSVIDTFLQPNGVSCHYIIDKNGEIVQMVKTGDCAFHAGKSDYGEWDWLNNDSVGIELVNWGRLNKGQDHIVRRWTGSEHVGPYHYLNNERWDHYPFAQMSSLVALTKIIIDMEPNINHITGHDYVSAGRKDDPGPAFDWNNYLLEVGLHN